MPFVTQSTVQTNSTLSVHDTGTLNLDGMHGLVETHELQLRSAATSILSTMHSR